MRILLQSCAKDCNRCRPSVAPVVEGKSLVQKPPCTSDTGPSGPWAETDSPPPPWGWDLFWVTPSNPDSRLPVSEDLHSYWLLRSSSPPPFSLISTASFSSSFPWRTLPTLFLPVRSTGSWLGFSHHGLYSLWLSWTPVSGPWGSLPPGSLSISLHPYPPRNSFSGSPTAH